MRIRARGQASVAGRYRAEVGKGAFGALQASPAYAMAGFLHMVLLVALSFWTIAVHFEEQKKEIQVRLAPAKEIVPVTAGMELEAEALDALLDASDQDLLTASEDATNDAFNEARGIESGEVNVFGVGQGGRSGKGRGGQVKRAGGASKASKGALNGGLDWLARHRTKEGVWTTVGRHSEGKKVKGAGSVARTGLAVLCFTAAGHGPDRKGSKYHGLVTQARDWLVSKVDRRGRFKTGGGARSQWMHCYEQAMGTLALAECLGLEREEKLLEAVQRAVRYIEETQSPSAGWRYGRGDTDTSVTSWMVLALKSAEHAGVPVSSRCYAGVRTWLDEVSSPAGTAGYVRGSSPTPSMTATALFLRITLGESPTDPMNRKAARLVSRHRLNVQGGGIQNLYGIYYAALAMYQVGGPQWRKFNPAIRDGLVSSQRRGTGCERGSWKGGGHINGKVLSTCFATLTLETYYRYMPVHEGTGDPEDDVLEEDEVPLTPGETQLEVATIAMDHARTEGDGGALLAAEAAYTRALRTLEKEGADWDLIGEARTRLVELATIGKDHELLRERIGQYMEKIPQTATPAASVLRLRRLDEYRRAMAAAQAAFGADGTKEQRQAAQEGISDLRDLLSTDLAGLEWGSDEHGECTRLLTEVEDAQTRLAFSVDPDQAIAEALELLAKTPPKGPVEPAERRVLVALLLRASRSYGEAVEKKSAQAYAAATQDFERWSQRRPHLRLKTGDYQRLLPMLERVYVAQAAALMALGDPRGAADSARHFADKFSESPRCKDAEAVERGALAQLVKEGRAKAGDRPRLAELIGRWTEGQDDLPPEKHVALGDMLLAAGNLDAAASRYLSCITSGVAPRLVENSARLGLARIARERGNAEQALGHLEAIRTTDAEGERLDVTLERCRLWRLSGKAEEALKEYAGLIRALSRTDPQQSAAWWQVAEDMSHAYLEAGDEDGARHFLEETRRQDNTFGGDKARRKRFIALIRKLDVLRARR